MHIYMVMSPMIVSKLRSLFSALFFLSSFSRKICWFFAHCGSVFSRMLNLMSIESLGGQHLVDNFYHLTNVYEMK